jgi:hypothetical protein
MSKGYKKGVFFSNLKKYINKFITKLPIPIMIAAIKPYIPKIPTKKISQNKSH